MDVDNEHTEKINNAINTILEEYSWLAVENYSGPTELSMLRDTCELLSRMFFLTRKKHHENINTDNILVSQKVFILKTVQGIIDDLSDYDKRPGRRKSYSTKLRITKSLLENMMSEIELSDNTGNKPSYT